MNALNEKALQAATATKWSVMDFEQTRAVVGTYLASLAEQGIVLVDVAEVASWLRERDRCHISNDHGWPEAADAIEAHFAPEASS